MFLSVIVYLRYFFSPAAVSFLCPVHSWTTGEEMAKDILQHRYIFDILIIFNINVLTLFSPLCAGVCWRAAEAGLFYSRRRLSG